MKIIVFLTYREEALYCCAMWLFLSFLMPRIWKLSSISNICTLCIPLYCCYLERFNPLNYNPFSQRVTDYISAIGCTLDMWDWVSSVMNDFLIIGKNVTIANGKPSIPFLNFAPTCSSASICHNRYDHGLLGASFLKYPSRMGEIQIKMPGFNYTEEGGTLQIPVDHSNWEAPGHFIQLSLFLVFRRKSRFGISWKLSSLSWWRGRVCILCNFTVRFSKKSASAWFHR